jgi:hypothetical protein
MHISPLIIAVSTAMVFGASAEDQWRTFTSADGTKKIEASLLEYTPKTEKVKLKLKAGKEAELSIYKFSRNDVKWIKETGTWQLRAANLKVAMKYDKVSQETIADEESDELAAALGEKPKRKSRRSRADSDARTIRVSKEGFKVFIANPGKEDIEALTCDYILFTLRKAADDKEIVTYEGSFTVDPIKAGGQFTAATEHVNLDRFERLLGMVLYIKHGDSVIRTVESKPGIEKLKEKAAKAKAPR